MPRGERGFSLLETIISVALIVLALTVFLGGLSVGGAGVSTVHMRVSSENLARAALEHVKKADYAESYEAVVASVPIPVPDYSLEVGTCSLAGNLQLITVTVLSGAETAFVIEEYKRGP
jgi:type II secretory pathway pseudopilin PulG